MWYLTLEEDACNLGLSGNEIVEPVEQVVCRETVRRQEQLDQSHELRGLQRPQGAAENEYDIEHSEDNEVGTAATPVMTTKDSNAPMSHKWREVGTLAHIKPRVATHRIAIYIPAVRSALLARKA